jgi:hypothetical protein
MIAEVQLGGCEREGNNGGILHYLHNMPMCYFSELNNPNDFSTKDFGESELDDLLQKIFEKTKP